LHLTFEFSKLDDRFTARANHRQSAPLVRDAQFAVIPEEGGQRVRLIFRRTSPTVDVRPTELASRWPPV